jgi:predicted KAP-like P-loop ATPase
MKTKEQETKELELRRQLEEVIEQKNAIQKKIDRLPTNKLKQLRELVEQRTALENKHKHLVNLYNIIS